MQCVCVCEEFFPKGMNSTDMTKSNQIFQTRKKINERSAKSQTLSY
jgi:hypothetical protein